MKKISSKIIISLLLAVFLWSGFRFTTPKTIAAVDCSAELTAHNASPTDPYKLTQYQNCLEYARDEYTNDGVWYAGIKSDYETAASNSVGTLADIIIGVWNIKEATILNAWLLLIFTILSFLLSIAASILDFFIHLSLGGFKNFIDSSNIVDTWRIIRDIINISFIFILLYISISTIIGGIGIKTKVLIKDIIISALLINFSMFITRVMIDAGNIVAVAIWDKILVISAGAKWGISGEIMNSLQLQKLLKLSSFIKATGQANTTFILVLSIITIGAAIWAFLYAAVIFLFRNVTLLLLITISPIGFIGGSLPWFKEKASEWWSALIEQIVVAPYFLFMIFIILKLIKGIKNSVGVTDTIINDLASFLKGGSELDYAMFINAFLIIGMLFVTIKSTKKLAGRTNDLVKIAAVAFGGMAAIKMGSIANGGGWKGANRAVIDFATGKAGDKPGFTGVASRYARNGLINVTKKLSNNDVDLNKIQNNYKKSLADQEKLMRKEADERASTAGRGSAERNAEIIQTLESIKNQTDNRFLDDTLTKEHANALKNEEEAQKKLKEAIESADRAPEGSNKEREFKKKKFEAEEELKLAKESTVTIKKKIDDAKEIITNEVVAEMGVKSVKELEDERRGLKGGLAASQKARSAYAAEIGSSIGAKFQNITGIGVDMKKVAQAIRTQKEGKYKDEEGDFKKILKKFADEQRSAEEKPKEGKKEDKKKGE